MISEHHQNLYDVLDEFLDGCDQHLDAGERFDISFHYRRINEALDRIYRAECGITQRRKTGRPLGCLDKVPRKRKVKRP